MAYKWGLHPNHLHVMGDNPPSMGYSPWKILLPESVFQHLGEFQVAMSDESLARHKLDMRGPTRTFSSPTSHFGVQNCFCFKESFHQLNCSQRNLHHKIVSANLNSSCIRKNKNIQFDGQKSNPAQLEGEKKKIFQEGVHSFFPPFFARNQGPWVGFVFSCRDTRNIPGTFVVAFGVSFFNPYSCSFGVTMPKQNCCSPARTWKRVVVFFSQVFP